MNATPAYDRLGLGYRAIRATDPKLAARIWSALGHARTVLNAGAGTGSYEPPDRWVLALEPSPVMTAPRADSAAPVLHAAVESLPLADKTVDAAIVILTIHHWSSVEAGLRELRRVTSQRIVIVTMDPAALANLWIVQDYLPELMGFHAARFPSIERLRELLPGAAVDILAVPHDCQDGFMAAFWARPHAYLDPAVRAATSPWHDLSPAVVDRALARLQTDLDSGAWERRYGELRKRAELDVGLRLVTANP